jgi:phage I-like protein
MPWKEKDAKKFKKDIADGDCKKWASVANNALKQCQEAGGKLLECETQAIKIANAKFEDTKLTDEVLLQFKDGQKAFVEKTKTEPAQILLAAVADDVEGSDGYQLVLPVGRFFLSYYGEVIFTESFMDAMVANWKNKALNQREPFIDTNHDMDKANGWIADLKFDSEGLLAKIDWTDEGKRLVSSKAYRYFSASIEQKMNIDTGEWIWPVLTAVSLTNSPAMNTLPKVGLKDESGKSLDNEGDSHENGVELKEENHPAHGDEMHNEKEGDNMEFADVLTAVAKLGDDEKKVVVTHLGLGTVVQERAQALSDKAALEATNKTLLSEKETLAKVNQDLTASLDTINKKGIEDRKTMVIGKALSEGRILPKDKDFWMGKFSENPDFAQSVIEKLPKVVALGEQAGTDAHEDADGKIDLSDVDSLVEANLRELGYSAETAKKE